MSNKLVFLVTGAIVTVLFWFFRVELYEALYTVNGFSDQMYNTGAYGSVAAITVAMAWGIAAYFLISTIHWFPMMQ